MLRSEVLLDVSPFFVADRNQAWGKTWFLCRFLEVLSQSREGRKGELVFPVREIKENVSYALDLRGKT